VPATRVQSKGHRGRRMTAVADPIYSRLGHDEDLADLIELFVQEIPDRLAVLRRLVDASDCGELARFAHQLKGAGGSYGFPELTTAAAALEQAAKGQASSSELVAAWNNLADIAVRLRPGNG
jgi:HPt (histidine-containing phosphotransfer) domain-containing protein